MTYSGDDEMEMHHSEQTRSFLLVLLLSWTIDSTYTVLVRGTYRVEEWWSDGVKDPGWSSIMFHAINGRVFPLLPTSPLGDVNGMEDFPARISISKIHKFTW